MVCKIRVYKSPDRIRREQYPIRNLKMTYQRKIEIKKLKTKIKEIKNRRKRFPNSSRWVHVVGY